MEPRPWPLRRGFQGISWAWRDTPSHLFVRQKDTTPAVCFGDCDYAYRVALVIGKSDRLCRPGAFMRLYQNCMQYLEECGEREVERYVESRFGQLVEYCDGKDAHDAQDAITTVQLRGTVGGFGPPTSTSGCDECITTVMTDWKKNTLTIVLGPMTVPTSSLLDKNVFPSTVKETYHVTHLVTTQASPTAASGIEADELDNSSGPNLATIVGPVVPSVVLLIVLAFLGFWWYKRKERIKDQEAQIKVDEEPKVEKAQLHSDCAPRPAYELEGSTPIVLDPVSADGAEMPANEVAAHEMPTDKKLGERTGESEEGHIRMDESKTGETKTEESKGEESKPDGGNPGNN